MKKSYVAGLMVVILLFGVATWLLYQKIDLASPVVRISPDTGSVGARTTLSLALADEGAGIKSVEVALIQGDKQAVPLKVEYPELGFFQGTGIHRKDLRVVLQPRLLGLLQGTAEMRVTVRDASWGRVFSGNMTLLRKVVRVDWVRPSLQVLSTSHYINRGGVGCIIYKLDEKSVHGVRVGDKFFPGYPCPVGKGVYCAYFAYPASSGAPPTSLTVIARDDAGNESKAGFYYKLRDKTFRSDNLELSPEWLSEMVSRLLPEADPNQPVIKNFLRINRVVRAANHRRIAQVCSKSSPSQLWEGPFLRLNNTAPMAGFGDRRSYYVNGQKIDEQLHQGVDLASLAAAPVQAANSGVVAMAEDLGIYGQCVIIDHGQGIFSLYGHMSNLSVTTGQKVQKGQVIGNSGATGLAGGDHVHFSMLVSGVFVNPVEWWDPHWIQDNVQLKFTQAKEMLAPPPPPPAMLPMLGTPAAQPPLNTGGVIR
ncbi:MAG: M23 family metallopeptidase [Pseudomonadota bacterium]